MTTTIALAGKGGVGKTTVAALVIKYLVRKGEGPVLAIDADPSTNLNLALGMEVDWTVGDIREDLLEQVKESLTAGGAAMGSLPGGQTKREYLDYQIRSSLAEGQSFDLIAMGRSEGTGCYCAVNHNLRQVIDAISRSYRYVVIDNEAGMEHLSRRTTRDVQHLFIVTDPSQRGILAAERIASFRNDLDIRIENAGLIINRIEGEVPPVLRQRLERFPVPVLGIIPASKDVALLDIEGKPVVDLAETSPTFAAVSQILSEIGL